jgi:hypothetical protein
VPPTSRPHWLIERRVRDYPKLVLGTIVVLAIAYALTFDNGLDPQGKPAGTDFLNFFSAGRMVLEGRALEAWDYHAVSDLQRAIFPGLEGSTPWAYPPPALLVVTPFALVPYGVGLLLWTALGLTLFVLALRPVIARIPHAWWLLAAFPGVWLGIGQGQTQFIIAALAGGALVLLDRRPVLAGVLIGLMVIKPQIAVLFPLLLIAQGRWRTFAAAAVAAVTATAVSLAAFGVESIDAWRESLAVLSEAMEVGASPGHKFVTPYPASRLLGIPPVGAAIVHLVLATAALAACWLLWRKHRSVPMSGAALVLGTFLVTPYAVDYDLALLAFAIAWWAAMGLGHGWRRGERNMLVVLWALPILTAPVAAATNVVIAPLCLAVALALLWVTARSIDPGDASGAVRPRRR